METSGVAAIWANAMGVMQGTVPKLTVTAEWQVLSEEIVKEVIFSLFQITYQDIDIFSTIC